MLSYTTPKTISKFFNSYFTSLIELLASKLSGVLFYDQNPDLYPMHYLNFQLQKSHVEFVYNQLRSAKQNKATGLDKIRAALIKLSAWVIAPSVNNCLNMSLETCTFPNLWKCAKALFKSGSHKDVSNDRPISVLPTLTKVLERTVHAHLTEKNYISNIQHGFKSKALHYFNTN